MSRNLLVICVLALAASACGSAEPPSTPLPPPALPGDPGVEFVAYGVADVPNAG